MTLEERNEALAVQIAEMALTIKDLKKSQKFDRHIIESLKLDRSRAEERAAVVAWLRECSNRCREWDGRELAVSATYRLAAAMIERGDHCREENP